ncbi:hypothetical protein DCCM_2738 [Desulfocucumis palustris]|uniref:TIGR02678 family protein n=1 Tax=Desulfocucumis palustris TaxID=1898651 RepID=A0A2L2XC12_9FIRM|nr:TIGR02678 family protein [Desulfocucumis palustris]GBF33632.1 hypothetical protein DCCM_2738 [Desulfocucumis palustris]
MSVQAKYEERRMALHDLLDRVLVTRGSSSDAYRRIFLHYHWLKEWFRERPGWRLAQWEDSYRLERVPARAVPGRGMEGLKEPLDYACLCWVLWFASMRSSNAQDWFALSELAREVQEISEGRFTMENRPHRESFVRALRLLQRLGVLTAYSGDEDHWVRAENRTDPDAEVLYDLASHSPRLLVMVGEEAMKAISQSDAGQPVLPLVADELPPLQRAWRTLLIGPVLWRGDDPEAFTALTESPQEVADDLHNSLGWQIEMGLDFARVWRTTTARGAAGLLLEVGAGLNAAQEDDVAPHIRYYFHPVLLLIGKIRDELAAGRLSAGPEGDVRLPEGDLRDYLVGLAEAHRGQWGQEMQKMNMGQLVDLIYRQMRRIGYLRGPDSKGYCYLLPGAASAVGYYQEPAEAALPHCKGKDEFIQIPLFDGLSDWKERDG